jgi:hypothetical protein
MITRTYFCFALIGFFSLVLFQYGCGKKGDPVSPRVEKIKAISNLTARLAGDKVELRWSIEEQQFGNIRFRIFRGITEKNDCLNCPQKYEAIAELDAKDAKKVEGEQNTFLYHDMDLKQGWFCRYRIVIVKTSAYSDISNTAEVKIE